MAVKYECPKCEKRFVDWGAEKLGYKCPQCDGEELVRIGSGVPEKPVRKPTLKRKKVERVKVADEVELDVVDPDAIDDADSPGGDIKLDGDADVADAGEVEVDADDADLETGEEEEEEEEIDELPKVLSFDDSDGAIPLDKQS